MIPTTPSTSTSLSSTSATQIEQLKTFFKHLIRDQNYQLSTFKLALDLVFGNETYSRKATSKLHAKTVELVEEVLPSASIFPGLSWITYQLPLRSPKELFDLVQEWKQHNPNFEFEPLCCFFLYRCFKAQRQIIDTSEYQKLFNHLAAAFESDFSGNRAEVFNRCVETYWNKVFLTDTYYSPTIPILQSSGCGKSRLVHELGHFWPMLSVCLRPQKTGISDGFPLSDIAAFSYLVDQQRASDTLLDPHLVIAAFLAAWLDVAYQDISSKPSFQNDEVHDIFSNWSYFKHTHNDTSAPNIKRQDFFDAIQQTANLSLSYFQERHLEAYQRLECWDQKSRYIADNMLSEPVTKILDHLHSHKEIRRRINRQKPTSTGDQKGLFYIAIDECTMLEKPDSELRLIHVLRLFQTLELCTQGKPFRFWLLLLDTNSSVTSLAPPKDQYPSERQKKLAPVCSFYNLGFDTLVHRQPKIRTASDVLCIDFLKYYGRPLWASYAPERALELAERKLYYGGPANLYDHYHVLATFSQLICLDLVPVRLDNAGAEIAKESVDKHMRVLTWIDADTITTRAPSEPMLAIAASSALRIPSSYATAINTLGSHLLNPNLVDVKGSNGELFVRLLLKMAKDACLNESDPGTDRTDSPTRSQAKKRSISSLRLGIPAVQVSSFLSNLVRDSPDYINLPKSCFINITHFIVLDQEISTIPSSFLWLLFCRGVAVQCSHRQMGIDGIIPVYVGNMDDEFPNSAEQDAPRKMTFIVWQAKYRRTSTSTDTTCLHGPEIDRKSNTSLMTIFHEIGTEAKIGSFKHGENWSLEEKNCIHRQKYQVLRIRGVENQLEVYPCLDHFKARETFSTMLGNKARTGSDDNSYLPFGPLWNQPKLNPGLELSESDSEENFVQTGFCQA